MNLKTLSITAVVLIASALALVSWQHSGRERGSAGAVTNPAQPGASPTPTTPLPTPKGRPILHVSGVSNGNAGRRTLKVDFATLDRLAHERVILREPFLKREFTFNVIRMSEFARLAGIPAGASLYMHALDDYHVVLPIDDIASVAFIATRVEGKPISVAQGGPIRLVFTGDESVAANTDNWIWSIDSMRVHG